MNLVVTNPTRIWDILCSHSYPDINECGPPLYMSCGSLAHCRNVEGGYYCECAPGHELLSGGTKFQSDKENTCQGKWLPCHTVPSCPRPASSYHLLQRSESPGESILGSLMGSFLSFLVLVQTYNVL